MGHLQRLFGLRLETSVSMIADVTQTLRRWRYGEMCRQSTVPRRSRLTFNCFSLQAAHALGKTARHGREVLLRCLFHRRLTPVHDVVQLMHMMMTASELGLSPCHAILSLVLGHA